MQLFQVGCARKRVRVNRRQAEVIHRKEVEQTSAARHCVRLNSGKPAIEHEIHQQVWENRKSLRQYKRNVGVFNSKNYDVVVGSTWKMIPTKCDVLAFVIRYCRANDVALVLIFLEVKPKITFKSDVSTLG